MILHQAAYSEALDIIQVHGFNITPENLARAICDGLTEAGFTVDPAENLAPILGQALLGEYASPESITDKIANDYGWMVTRIPRKSVKAWSPELTESLRTTNAKNARRNAGWANRVPLHHVAEVYAEDYHAFPVSGDALAREYQTI